MWDKLQLVANGVEHSGNMVRTFRVQKRQAKAYRTVPR